jgi:hypothetical protein
LFAIGRIAGQNHTGRFCIVGRKTKRIRHGG